MLKGVEGKKEEGKARCGRGRGSMKDEDDGSPGGGSGCGRGCGHGCHVIPGDRLPPKPQKMGSATKSQPQEEWTAQRMQSALDLYKRR